MKSFDWLNQLASDVRSEVLSCASERRFDKNTIIQHGNERATHVHQIVIGRVRQFILDENGNEILLQTYLCGDVIGDSLGLGDRPYPLWLSTEGEVTLRSWTIRCFDDLRVKHPAIGAAIDAQTGHRFHIAIALLTEFATLDAYGRVAGRLLHLSQYAQMRGALHLDSSQEDLAMMANVSRQTVNKVVAELADLGVVQGGYGSILVKNVDALLRYKNSHRRRP